MVRSEWMTPWPWMNASTLASWCAILRMRLMSSAQFPSFRRKNPFTIWLDSVPCSGGHDAGMPPHTKHELAACLKAVCWRPK